MRPILLKGHERSITVVKYNYDGDLLFTASKDHVPSVWRAEDGGRLGTFAGHKGTIWDLDIDRFTTRVLTASADASARLWDAETGECIKVFSHRGPVRGVAWADGSNSFATISDPFVDHNAQISIYDIPQDASPDDYDDTPRLEIDLPKTNDGKRVNPTNVVWLNLNEALFVTFDNGSIRLYDPVTGDELEEFFPHEKKINRVSFNKEKTLFITSSADFTAKLYDVVNLHHLKTYKTERPVNDAVIHPHKDHILLGGGQEAMSVTTTRGDVGKFETRFFHLVYEEEFGKVKGHFGPINAIGINPNGRSYASGAEDGYVRLHFFDKSYLDMKDPVPEAPEGEEEENDGYDEKNDDSSDDGQ
uniref:Eukaryotic translation initiation factor 3 subunit I n=1 Tax=Ditylum brightwellii TaxID=49249 RepID=A0A6V2L3S8_9STRA